MTEEQVYNEAYYGTIAAQRVERGWAWHEYRAARQIVRTECVADREWSERADTARWCAENAMEQIRQLDRMAHEAAMAAIGANA